MFTKKDDISFLNKIKHQISKLPTKELQLELLGNRLPPLDFYNNIKFSLDDWQIEVLKYIKSDFSVLVTAPTSSGKTILSTYFATIGKTVLYVVPSKPLAFQVASIFHSIAGEGIAIFVDDFSYYPSNDIRVVVGTPYEIENKFYALPELDIAVFDEIHNINSDCGACYERIIKWHTGNFLALSATIQNPEIVLDWLNSLVKGRIVKLVSYKKKIYKYSETFMEY
jgi:superfamily II RNA helicase